MTLTHSLQQGLETLQLDLPNSTQTQLINYLELLTQWNQIYNLTAVREMAQMMPKHVFDSLAVLPYVYGAHILDVGTGAGLPGLVLAMACPDWHWVLLDSSAKKIRFVKQAIIELQINNAEAICTRIEKFQPQVKFNSIISRAYGTLSHFYRYSTPLCAKQGCILAMKGLYPKKEIDEMANLPVHLDSISLHVPQLAAHRHLIIMRSTAYKE